MITVQTYYNVILSLGFFISFFVGTAIYARQRGSGVNREWFLVSLLASSWSIFYLLTINTNDAGLSLVFVRLANISAIFLVLTWVRFIDVFLEIHTKRVFKNIFRFLFSLGVIFTIANFLPGFIKEMVPKYIFTYYVEPGLGYYLYTVFIILAILYGFSLLFVFYKKYSGTKGVQIKYIIIASVMGFVGGLNVFLLAFNIFFPPYLLILFSAFPIAIVYAITKHHLFDIKVITTELLTVIMWLLLLTKLFVSIDYQDFIINVCVLLFVIIVGVLLIRSVVKEVSLREKIEILVKDLEAANDKLEKANEKLKLLDQQKSEFVSLATHQIRGPLTAIKGFASLMTDGDYGEVPGKLREPIDRIAQSTQGLISLVEDYLNISRVELGGMKYAMTEVDFCKLVSDTTNELKPNVDKKGLSLMVNVPQMPVMIHADLGKLKQVVSNLIDNAAKYTERGSININLVKSAETKKALLSISDTGMGISPETMLKLFQKFSRAAEASEHNAGGAGIGLFLAKQIVEAHHGKIWAESAGLGKGSTFKIELNRVSFS